MRTLFALLFCMGMSAHGQVCLIHESKNGAIINDVQKPFSMDKPWEFSSADGFFWGRAIYQNIPLAKGYTLILRGGGAETSTFVEYPYETPLLELTVGGRSGYLRCNFEP